MTLRTTVGELPELVGRDLGVSDWFLVDQDRVDTFADATNDHQWIHVDPDRAATGPFSGTIAHGYLTLALVPDLLAQLLVVEDEARGANYGLERVRFTSPVPVGANIRLAASLNAVTVRPDNGVQYHVAMTVEIEGQDRPALIGETIYLSYA